MAVSFAIQPIVQLHDTDGNNVMVAEVILSSI
jgi:hypothetical protein